MEVTLQQVLDARENRVRRHRGLIARFHKPLICFTMNIAGPEKNNRLITQGFQLGDRMLLAQLAGAQVELLYREHALSVIGCEGYYVVDCDAVQLKRLAVEVEDSAPVGRLFDMDVLAADGTHITRETLGLPERTCLLCDKPARVCGSRRAHSVEELKGRTDALLRQAVREDAAQTIAAKAVQALLYEVCTTPKPGLVDCQGNGSHRDMDIFTFMASSSTLSPYFTRCARIGMETAELAPEETFRRLRLPGKIAEQAMLDATDGVNTHKGAIFCLGILCGAAGRLEGPVTPEAVLSQCVRMTRGLTARELTGVTADNAVTAGQRLYAEHGITGIRGQVEAGFPAVRKTGLPVLEEGLRRGLSLNDAGCAALLHLLTAATDTNLIARSNVAVQQQTVQKVAAVLQQTPYPDRAALEALDREFIKKNLSPGGSADLLAVTYFLHFLQ